jgi:hypothetical protein
MKQWIWFVLALLAVALVLKFVGFEGFTGGPADSRFVDRSQQNRAMKMEDSSYAQKTNHFVQNNSVGEAPGVDSPWQVNQFKSRM